MNTEYVLNTELFTESFMFKYKWNRHIVLWVKQDWVYLIDIDYDKDFDIAFENPVYFETFWTLSTELLSEDKLDYFIKQNYADNTIDYDSDNTIF